MTDKEKEKLRMVDKMLDWAELNSVCLDKKSAESLSDYLIEKDYGTIETARKEIAKDILQKLKFLYKERKREYTNWDTNKVQAVTVEWLNADIEEMAQNYGVKSDE